MKNTKPSKGRRLEMKVSLGAKTIERWKAHYAEGDYAEIKRMVKEPPTTVATISNHINSANEDSNWKVPLSVAKAITTFYQKKERAQKELAA